MDIRNFFNTVRVKKSVVTTINDQVEEEPQISSESEPVGTKSTAAIAAVATVKASTIGKWKTQFPWMVVFNKENGATYIACATCRKYAENANLENKNTNITLFIDGCGTLKHHTLSKHEKSKFHIMGTRNQIARTDFSSTPMGKILSKMPEEKLKKMKIFFNTAYSISSNNLPFSMFPELCKLQIKNGLNLGDTYLNDKSCVQFLKYISKDLQQQFIDVLNSCVFISILSDSSTDRSTAECEIIYVTCIMRNGERKSQFLNLVQLHDGKSETIFNCICETMSRFLPNWEEKLVGICLDGASVNFGLYRGVATRMKSHVAGAIAVHCVAHRLELIISDALKNIVLARQCEDILKFVYKLYSKSPKLLNELKDMAALLEENLLRNTAVLNTRWIASKNRALTALINNFAPIVQHLENLCKEDNTAEKAAKIKGHLNKLKSVQMMRFISFMVDLTHILSNVSKTFQKNDISVEECKVSIDATKNLIKSLIEKTGKEEQKFESNLTETFEYKTTKLSCKNDDIRNVRSAICSKIIFQINTRYADFFESKILKNYHIFDAINLPKNEHDLFSYGTEELQEILQDLPSTVKSSIKDNDVDADYMFWKLWAKNKTGRFSEMWDRFIAECIADDSSDFAKCQGLIKIILMYRVLPVSTAICERGFSLLNNIKTDKRNSLSVETTDLLMRIKLHGPPIEHFNSSASIEMWWNDCLRKRKPEFTRGEKSNKKRKTAFSEMAEAVEVGDADTSSGDSE